ncbi:Frataxin-like protein [Smittium mucronatum]|uniref:ferroxidase n=1 Tax=Smittium mucronatum TaxID=133383 RepID=A0A1R0H5T9_9FUNG|nr:Frataxin-like protein [Smittium mucronatum]
MLSRIVLKNFRAPRPAGIPLLSLKNKASLAPRFSSKYKINRNTVGLIRCHNFSTGADGGDFAGGSSENHVLLENEFRRISGNTLVYIQDSIEEFSEDSGTEIDIEFSAGVLNINFGRKGSYVLNQQPPNRQIWFSSPISGPKRFEYDSDSHRWTGTKDGEDLIELLSNELSKLLEMSVIIPPEPNY